MDGEFAVSPERLREIKSWVGHDRVSAGHVPELIAEVERLQKVEELWVNRWQKAQDELFELVKEKVRREAADVRKCSPKGARLNAR